MDVSKVISGSSYTSEINKQPQTINHSQKKPAETIEKNVNGVLQQKTLYSQARTHGNHLVERVDIESMVEGLNDFLQPVNTSIRFVLHDKLDRYYVKVVDAQTEELVREIPPEQMLDMYAAMAEFMGLIVDEKI
ncbi:MAG TPA: flagellar protein FlaG [Bacilli bacterium]|nr:flagellar protein FlaG [Bacilli bacterium]